MTPKTGELLTGDIETETRQVLDNLGAILEAAGTSFENILKCSVFVSDIENFGQINTVYATYFNEATAPARALVEVANLPKYVNVEISCIAAVDLVQCTKLIVQTKRSEHPVIPSEYADTLLHIPEGIDPRVT